MQLLCQACCMLAIAKACLRIPLEQTAADSEAQLLLLCLQVPAQACQIVLPICQSAELRTLSA